eukprot:9811799-Alexandrium_andersonii.AAC.1
MSASLVGSEMCIRDRAYVCHSVSAGSCRQFCPVLLQCPCRSDDPVLASPVSYTHLTLPTICSV